MPPEEQAYWHDHKYEIGPGLLKSLTQSGADEAATLAKIRTLRGKVFHTWVSGQDYPEGPAQLWSVTGKVPFVLPHDVKLTASWRRLVQRPAIEKVVPATRLSSGVRSAAK